MTRSVRCRVSDTRWMGHSRSRNEPSSIMRFLEGNNEFLFSSSFPPFSNFFFYCTFFVTTKGLKEEKWIDN